MIRIPALLIVLLSAALTTATAASAQATGPTAAQLQRAILAEQQLGRAWELASSGPLVDGIVSHSATFRREQPVFEVLSLGLADLRTGSPRDNALDYIAELTGMRAGERVRPLPFGRDGVRYAVQFAKGSFFYYGDIAAWQQGQVIVIVALVSEDPGASVYGHAQLQYDKLAATIP